MVSFQRHIRSRRAAERELGNVDGADSPGLAAVSGLHVSSNTVALGHSVDVLGVSNIQDDFGIDPRCERNIRVIQKTELLSAKRTVGADSAAVVFGALNSAAPALGLSVAGGKGGYGLVVDENGLCVITGRVIELVCRYISPVPS